MAMRLGARRATVADRTFGAFELRKLDWDTTHFGQKMGVLAVARSVPELRSALVSDLRLCLREAADDGYAHVILRMGVEELPMARIAEECGMRLIDVSVDLVTTLEARHALPAFGPSLRAIGRPGDVDAIRSIAEDAFEHSRFNSDPFFSHEQSVGFHRQWISNLCSGLADVVLVAEAGNEVAGFTSCVRQKDGTGRIPLIATSENHRRQGVGRALIDASLRWFASAGLTTAYVKTQVANYPALALYSSAGFTVAKGELTYSAMPSAMLRRPKPIDR